MKIKMPAVLLEISKLSGYRSRFRARRQSMRK